jgi:putative membrane protein
MYTPTLKRVAAALIATGFAAGAVAQTTSTPPAGAGTRATTEKPSLDRADRKFIEEASRDGLAEVELGKLAAQKAQAPEVKQFAQRMVEDHGKANRELAGVAQAKGVAPAADVDGKHKRMMERMAKLDGAKFDREYMNEMTDEHKKDVKAFREAARDAKDPDLKRFAVNTLPVLEEHLKMAENLHARVKDMDRAARSGASSASGSSAAGTGSGR